VAGLRGGRTGIAYTSSKWALVGMAQNIASSLGPEGIRAYAIVPAWYRERLFWVRSRRLHEASLIAVATNSSRPPTTPEDVANVVAFLVSDESRHLNGIAVPIDSGWLAY